MPSKEEIARVRKMVSQAKASEQRAQGVLEELNRELLEVWECCSIEEAEDRLAEMEEELRDLEKAAEKEYAKFKEKWDAWEESK